jgi:SnoaL-like domain
VADSDRLDRLEKDLAAALAEIDRLKAIEAIRECIYRVCRGTDRIDAEAIRSAFHPGATVHFGKMYDGDIEGMIAATMKHQSTQSQRQHMVGNIIIRIDGDQAFAESYELDRHKTPMNGEVRDLVLAARTLDRFERRNGEWKIVERTKVMDWGRSITADDGVYANSPLATGGDDRSDLSYGLLA